MVVLAPVALVLCGPALPLEEVHVTALVKLLALVPTATALWMVLLVPVLVRHTLPVMSAGSQAYTHGLSKRDG